MKLLHTADWHVGKTIKGLSRIDEHTRVLGDIVLIADTERVDAVIIAGDIYETASPGPDAEALVLRTLLDLRDTGARVFVIAGNHDNAARFDAVRPVFAAIDVDIMGTPLRPSDGGLLEFTTSDGTGVRIARLPFCSQRSVLRAQQLLGLDAAALAATYDERIRQLLQSLTEGFADDAVNLVVSHCMVTGAHLGGGERSAQTYLDYWVGAQAFPAHANYVALGHLHRTQSVNGPAPAWYSGSPIQVDFGERDEPNHALVVTAAPGHPSVVDHVEVAGARRLRTIRGTLDELASVGVADEYLRVVVTDPPRAGLADRARELLGEHVVEVRLEASVPTPAAGPSREQRAGRSPHELFAEFLGEQQIDDRRLGALFARLLDVVER